MAQKVIFLLSCFFISSFSVAQSVVAKKEMIRINGENADGVAVELDGARDDVSSSFLKYLKTFGKTKQAYDYITITEATLNNKTYTLPIFAQVQEKEKVSRVWIGIKTSAWPTNETTNIDTQLEHIVYVFGVQFYKDKIQVQIDESNRALQAVERQQQRFSNQNRDLNTNLEDNKREKIQLEKSLETNKLEYATLLQKIDKNKKDQDSLKVANDQIKKVIDMQRDKQAKIK